MIPTLEWLRQALTSSTKPAPARRDLRPLSRLQNPCAILAPHRSCRCSSIEHFPVGLRSSPQRKSPGRASPNECPRRASQWKRQRRLQHSRVRCQVLQVFLRITMRDPLHSTTINNRCSLSKLTDAAVTGAGSFFARSSAASIHRLRLASSGASILHRSSQPSPCRLCHNSRNAASCIRATRSTRFRSFCFASEAGSRKPLPK